MDLSSSIKERVEEEGIWQQIWRSDEPPIIPLLGGDIWPFVWQQVEEDNS